MITFETFMNSPYFRDYLKNANADNLNKLLAYTQNTTQDLLPLWMLEDRALAILAKFHATKHLENAVIPEAMTKPTEVPASFFFKGKPTPDKTTLNKVSENSPEESTPKKNRT